MITFLSVCREYDMRGTYFASTTGVKKNSRNPWQGARRRGNSGAISVCLSNGLGESGAAGNPLVGEKADIKKKSAQDPQVQFSDRRSAEVVQLLLSPSQHPVRRQTEGTVLFPGDMTAVQG